MAEREELRGFRTIIRGGTLIATKGDQVVKVRLDTITSVLYTRINRLPQTAQSTGVLLILLPWAFFALTPMYPIHVMIAVFSNILGLGLIIGYHTIQTWAMDIETEDRNYVIAGRKKDLWGLRASIDEHRKKHGQEKAVEEDRALDSDTVVYDRVDSSTLGEDVSMYDDIDACVRCGSTNLGMPSIAEGGIPGVFDVSGQIVCRNCGLVAPSLRFDRKEDHDAHVAALKEEGRIDGNGRWTVGPEGDEAQR